MRSCLAERGRMRAPARLSWGLLLFVIVRLLGGPGQAQTLDGQNIAPLTPYVLTPAPNYALAKGVPDKVLTDGKRPTTVNDDA